MNYIETAFIIIAVVELIELIFIVKLFKFQTGLLEVLMLERTSGLVFNNWF